MSYHEPPCVGEAKCSKCKQTKHVLAFAVHPDMKNGRQAWCRDCYNAYSKKRRLMRLRDKPRKSNGAPWSMQGNEGTT